MPPPQMSGSSGSFRNVCDCEAIFEPGGLDLASYRFFVHIVLHE